MSLGKIWQCHEQSQYRLKKKLINLSWEIVSDWETLCSFLREMTISHGVM